MKTPICRACYSQKAKKRLASEPDTDDLTDAELDALIESRRPRRPEEVYDARATTAYGADDEYVISRNRFARFDRRHNGARMVR